MRILGLALLALALAASPALASGSIVCETTDGSGVGLVIGGMAREPGALPDYAQIERGGRIASSTRGEPPGLAIGPDRSDADTLSLDLLDPRGRAVIARLWARFGGEGNALGRLFIGGRSHPVECLFG